VKVGDIVNVTVLNVDMQKKRIALSMKSGRMGAAHKEAAENSLDSKKTM